MQDRDQYFEVEAKGYINYKERNFLGYRPQDKFRADEHCGTFCQSL